MSNPDPPTDPRFHDRINALAEAFLLALQSGEDPELDRIVGAHPDLAPSLEKRLRTVLAIWQSVRQKPDESATQKESFDEGTREFTPGSRRSHSQRVKCPHCGIGLNVISEKLVEVTCSGCGSSVRVDPEATVSGRSRLDRRRIGRFQLSDVLGEGAFGTVYKAWDPVVSRYVAVKVPRQGFFATPREEQRFFREARNAGELSHPNIVRVYQVAEDDGLPFIVSELVEGVTLADLIRGRQLSFREAAELLATASEAIQHAHDRGVIHRDIKPSNILVDRSGRPHVSDFGLARHSGAEVTMTMEGEVLGTPAYMSPEQASGLSTRIDGRSDVYSLGVVLYRMLAGQLPFRGSQRMLLNQVLNDDPKSPRAVNDAVPIDLETIALKAMRKDPRQRYATAADLAADLRRWLAGDPILARPLSTAARVTRWCRRRPGVTTLLSLVTLLLVGSAALGVGWGLRENTLGNQIAEQRNKAVQQRDVATDRLARSFESRGIELMNRNRLVESMPWFVQSLATDPAAGKRHRLRLGIVQSLTPVLTRLWNSRAKVVDLDIDARGAIVAAGCSDGVTRLFDYVTGAAGPELQHGTRIREVTFDRQGNRIATVAINDQEVRLWRATDGQLESRLAHTDSAWTVAFPANGGRIATGGFDQLATIWDAAGGTRLRDLRTEASRVTQLQWFLNDTRLVTVSLNPLSIENPDALSVVEVWDPDSGAREARWTHAATIRDLAISEDGSRILTGGTDGMVLVADAGTGEELRRVIHATAVRSAGFLSANEIVVVQQSGQIARWDLSQSSALVAFDHDSRQTDAVVSPSGDFVATAGADGRIRVSWTGTGASVCSALPTGQEATSVVFHPDGRTLLAGDHHGVIRAWDLAGAAPPGPVLDHAGSLTGAHYSAAGDRVVTSSQDHTARLWQVSNGLPVGAPLAHDGPVSSCSFSSDGRYVVTSSADQTARVWDALSGAAVGAPALHEAPVMMAAFRPGGDEYATGDQEGRVRIWRVNQPAARLVLALPTEIRWVTFSPDGSRLAAASRDGTAQVWNADNGQPVGDPVAAADIAVRCEFSPDGRTFAVAGRDQKVHVRDLITGADLQLQHTGSLSSVSFGRANLLIATDYLGNAVIWQKQDTNWTELWRVHDAQGSLLPGVFSPEADLLGLGSMARAGQRRPGKGVARIWDAVHQVPVSPPLNHMAAAWEVEFRPDARQLLSRSRDGTARLWPLDPEELQVDTLTQFAALISGRQVSANGRSRRLEPAELATTFASLSDSHPERFQVAPEAVQRWEEDVKRVLEFTGDND